MSLLLDTHALLWFLADDPQLSDQAREAIAGPDTFTHASLASAWEIALKLKLGKLSFPTPLRETFLHGCTSSGLRLLPIEVSHIDRTLALPFHHRDPFDRLLVAQCLEERLRIVSADPALDAYGVVRVW